MITMKRQVYMLAIAFILMLTMCGTHMRHTVASSPERTSTGGVSAPLTLPETLVDANLSFEDVLSGFVYDLLHTVTDSEAQGVTAEVTDIEVGHAPGRSGNSNDGNVDTDPYRLRARAQLRAPSLPGASAPTDRHPDHRRH